MPTKRRRRPSIKITTTTLYLSLLCGFLGSVGLGYMAVEYNIVAKRCVATDADFSGKYTLTGYLLAIYHFFMILCRTWVKGQSLRSCTINR